MSASRLLSDLGTKALNSYEDAHITIMSTFETDVHLRAPSTSAMAFVFEGDFDLGSVKLDLAVADNHVFVHDFRYAQLAQMFSGLLDHVFGGVFPALGAGSNEFDNVVSALGIDNFVRALGHERISFFNAAYCFRGS
jgi:hypothetical protein